MGGLNKEKINEDGFEKLIGASVYSWIKQNGLNMIYTYIERIFFYK